MPRAKRIYSPGYVWHLTHRCHNRAFLLKFERDRIRWRHWLFEARKRHALSVLDYMVTSNHIHLLVRDNGDDGISKSMHLIAGRVAQEYNRRKSRRGAFWEDRYFATAVATDQHLVKCLVYIDLNMVRAGVVRHPSQWKVCGYNEIQSTRSSYRVIDFAALCDLTGSQAPYDFRREHRAWVETELKQAVTKRQPEWTEENAVGPDSFRNHFQRRK
jgi:putative transposase